LTGKIKRVGKNRKSNKREERNKSDESKMISWGRNRYRKQKGEGSAGFTIRRGDTEIAINQRAFRRN